MPEDGPYIYAWCNPENRTRALIAALDDPAENGWRHEFTFESSKPTYARWSGLVAFNEIAAAIDTHYSENSHVETYGGVKLRSGRALSFDLDCYGEAYAQRFKKASLEAQPGIRENFLPYLNEFALGGPPRSPELEAAIFLVRTQADIEDLFLRVCAPEASAVTSAVFIEETSPTTPVLACATYHVEAAEVARDLALSWIQLHDHPKLALIGGLPLATLYERVEASPSNAWVTVTKDTTLSRDAVLKAIHAPPADLLEALAAAAVPDPEWRAVEPIALESIAAARAGVETYEATVRSRRHLQFIERHAPYHVRRLPNGGVLLATHPYRTLWPLWQDALLLLDITP